MARRVCSSNKVILSLSKASKRKRKNEKEEENKENQGASKLIYGGAKTSEPRYKDHCMVKRYSHLATISTKQL
ncbi:hypothetical protein M514_05788 [Trichuris suis]|uniref:Uncharacterized protein n=1 Tax=Trichuris suis TaxID=68888 RepID=A0A085NA98_9BILA|nr:hypothetical protein M513_05788 [Trichuris suis]KFD66394.1 hypothetical protein M514_05788 [Trichuris suis]